jgi:hypothetical protein
MVVNLTERRFLASAENSPMGVNLSERRFLGGFAKYAHGHKSLRAPISGRLEAHRE